MAGLVLWDAILAMSHSQSYKCTGWFGWMLPWKKIWREQGRSLSSVYRAWLPLSYMFNISYEVGAILPRQGAFRVTWVLFTMRKDRVHHPVNMIPWNNDIFPSKTWRLRLSLDIVCMHPIHVSKRRWTWPLTATSSISHKSPVHSLHNNALPFFSKFYAHSCTML